MSDNVTPNTDRLPELIIPIDEVIFNNKKYTELSLSEPSSKTIGKANELLVIVDGQPTLSCAQPYLIKLISGHTGLPASIIENLPVSVVNRAGNYLASFTMEGWSRI